MKRLIATTSLFLLASVSAFAGEWSGFVTDAKCATAGKAGAEHAGCAKGCIGGGAEAVLVDADGKIHHIANQDKITSHAGENVKVTGSVADGKITVESVSSAD